MTVYVHRGEDRPFEWPASDIPPLVQHKRRPPRTHSFGNDDEARLAAKRETNAAYRERNKARVLARQREWYAQSKKIAPKSA